MCCSIFTVNCSMLARSEMRLPGDTLLSFLFYMTVFDISNMLVGLLASGPFLDSLRSNKTPS